MQLTSVELCKFKSPDATYPLEKCNLIVGPNGAGKSAIIQGLRFAIQGDTEFGALPSDAAKLCGPNGGSVSVKTSMGVGFVRAVAKDHKSKELKTVVAIAGSEDLGVREADARIAAMCGRFAPAFNLGAFLNLSADKRRNFVLDLCSSHGPGGGVQPDELIDKMRVEYLKLALGDGTVEMAIKAGLVAKLPDEMKKAERDALAASLGEIKKAIAGDITDAIAATLDRAKDLTSQSKADHDRARAASQELSQRKASLQVVADSVGDLQSQLATLSAERDELIESIGNAEGRAKSLEAEERNLQAAIESVAVNELALKAVKAQPVASYEELVRLGYTIEEKRETLDLIDAVDLRSLSEQMHQISVERRAVADKLAAMQSAATQNNREIENTEAAIDAINDGDWERAHAICRSLNEGMQTIAKKSELHAGYWNELIGIIERNRSTDAMDALHAKLTRLRSKTFDVDSLEREWLDYEDRMCDAGKAYDIAVEQDAKRKAISDELANLRTERDTKQDAQEDHDRKEQGLLDAIEHFHAQRVEAERRHTELLAEGASPVAELREQLNRVGVVMAGIRVKIEDKQKFQTLESEFTRCIADAERAQVTHDTCKQLQAAIKAVRETLMDSLVRPLTSRIDQFLQHAAPSCRVYCNLLTDRGRPDFELGWTVEDIRRIPLETMSGGEAATFCAALAYAMVTLSYSPLKLLMLEASELDDAALTRVIYALEMLSEHVGNVFVATCHAHGARPGWNVIEPAKQMTAV